MTKSIGIVTSDPVIAGAIYMRMVYILNSRGIVNHHQPDVYLYSPRLAVPLSDQKRILEGTEVMRVLNAHSVVFPDNPNLRSMHSSGDLLSRSNIILPDIAILEGRAEDIKKSILSDPHGLKIGHEEPGVVELRRAIDAWAEFLIQEIKSPEDHAVSLQRIARTKGVDSRILQEVKDPKRHKKGLIGCQGGMSPQSGVEFFVDTALHSESSIILMSVPTTPHFVPSVVEMAAEGLDYVRCGLNNPVPKLRDVMSKLGSVGCSVIVPVCNTVHYFFDAFRDWGVKTVNFPQAGVAAIPHGTKAKKTRVLLLATEASIKGKVFDRATAELSRDDIEWLMPTAQQARVSEAIWDNIIKGKYAEGGDILMEVIASYEAIHGRDFLIMCGCTEVVMGIGDRISHERIIDNAEAARDQVIRIVNGMDYPGAAVGGLASATQRAVKAVRGGGA